MTYSSPNNCCKKENTELDPVNLAPNVLAEATVVATGAPIVVKICFYGHRRGVFVGVILWTLDFDK